jgi:hypothetical protein
LLTDLLGGEQSFAASSIASFLYTMLNMLEYKQFVGAGVGCSSLVPGMFRTRSGRRRLRWLIGRPTWPKPSTCHTPSYWQVARLFFKENLLIFCFFFLLSN